MENYDTLKYYNDNAEEYCEQTKNGDMKELYEKFLFYLPKKGKILDFGCGSGRDSKFFLENGYFVSAIDGSEKMCELATQYIGQEVKCMKFEELNEESQYDGIWACSSILHAEREKLPEILQKMMKALKKDGIIYTCFKVGDYLEIKEGKYYNYMTKETLAGLLKNKKIDLEIIDYFESGTKPNINRPTTTWGNYIMKKKKVL